MRSKNRYRSYHDWGKSMPQVAAVGDGPIVYLSDAGQEVFLPLSDIVFDATGTAKSKTMTTTPPALARWLAFLVAQGRLSPEPVAAAGDAVTITASTPGAAGNNIVVTVVPAGAGLVDVTVTETDTYRGLTLATIGGLLGFGTTPGSKPGMLLLTQAVANNAPDPAEGTVAEVTPPTDPPTWKVVGPTAAGPTASFTLKPRGTGSDKGTTTVTISAVKPATTQPVTAATTFTLEVVWTRTVTGVGAAGVDTLAHIGTTFRDVEFVARAGEPSPGAGGKVPRPGTVQLTGGAEAQSATPATATLLATS
jgi:hypothetical protein